MKPAFGLLSKFRARAQGRAADSELLNLGCGARTHPAWINVDFRADPPRVIGHDLRTPLPFATGSFSAVYASHLLEHFPRDYAPVFLGECRRVLKSGGMARIVVPDLEMIARLYLKYLDGAVAGDEPSARRHEWMTIELLDQLTRERGGGEMARYWKRNPLPEEEFVLGTHGLGGKAISGGSSEPAGEGAEGAESADRAGEGGIPGVGRTAQVDVRPVFPPGFAGKGGIQGLPGVPRRRVADCQFQFLSARSQ